LVAKPAPAAGAGTGFGLGPDCDRFAWNYLKFQYVQIGNILTEFDNVILEKDGGER
jgi:hypothetical protein